MLKYATRFKSKAYAAQIIINRRQWYLLRYTEINVYGDNYCKCLGLSKPENIKQLSLVNKLTGLRSVSFGPSHTVFIRWDNEAYTSGCNR